MALRLAQISEGNLIYLYQDRVYDAISLNQIDRKPVQAKILIENLTEWEFMSNPVLVRTKKDFGIFTTGEQLGIIDMFPLQDRDDLLYSTDPIVEVIPFKLPRQYRLPTGPVHSLPGENAGPFHELWLKALRDGRGISEIYKPHIEAD